MKTFLTILTLCVLSCLSGCATMPKTDTYAQEQKRKLILARMLLEDNRVRAAKEILTDISNGKGTPGVTDEALFHLALLNLEPGGQKILTKRAGLNLDRLLKEYPASPWKSHAITVKGVIDAYDLSLEQNTELEKTIRNLKSSQQSLGKENRELRQDLEKLKKLDLELERK